jgi:hypothetical protein
MSMSQREEQAIKAVQGMFKAILETIEELGEQGTPGGVIYLALSQYGVSMSLFEAMMAALLDTRKIRQEGNLYYPVRRS